MRNEIRTQTRSWWATEEECGGEAAVEETRTEAMTTKAGRGEGGSERRQQSTSLTHSLTAGAAAPLSPPANTTPPTITFS